MTHVGVEEAVALLTRPPMPIPFALAAVGLLVVTGLAGCIQQAAPGPLDAARGVTLPRPEIALPKFDPVTVLEQNGGGTEPNIRVGPQDHVYVTTTGTRFWRSMDGGATFEVPGNATCSVPVLGPANLTSCPPTRERKVSGLNGGGDGSLAVDRQGRLFWAGLAGSEGSVPFQFSLDEGSTWSKGYDLATGNSSDREWIAAGPSGTLYAIWRDFGGCAMDLVVACAPDSQGNTPSSSLFLRTSKDAGQNWTAPITVVEGAPISGQIVIDPVTEELYVPFIGDDAVGMAHSADGGATWTLAKLPSAPYNNFGISLFIFPVAAVDAAGTVYAAWAQDPTASTEVPSLVGKAVQTPHVFMSVSKDHGATWSKAEMMSPPDKAALFPALVAGSAGRVALAWYESMLPVTAPSDTFPNEWVITLAESVTADQAAPKWVNAIATPEPIHLGTICTGGLVGCNVAGDRSRGDFFEIALRPNGQPILAFVRDSMLPAAVFLAAQDVAVVRVIEGTPLLDSIGTKSS